MVAYPRRPGYTAIMRKRMTDLLKWLGLAIVFGILVWLQRKIFFDR